MWTIIKKIWYMMYKLLAAWLPISQRMPLAKRYRAFFAKHIVAYRGKNVNIPSDTAGYGYLCIDDSLREVLG